MRPLIRGFAAMILTLGIVAGVAVVAVLDTDHPLSHVKMLPGDDQGILSEMDAAIEKVRHDYHLPPVLVRTEYFFDDGIMAETQSITPPGQPTSYIITFNHFYTSDPQLLRSTVNTDVKSGFHPGGCSAAQLIATHEIGHVIDAVNHHIARAVLWDRYGGRRLRGLTGYSYGFYGSVLNPGEALAEAFAAVKCEGDKANRAERTLFDILTSGYPQTTKKIGPKGPIS
jgi:hypothetical protein